ncbi:MAG TPA: hypothetical protein VHI98_05335 [Vicinamibacterales bacterium]|jgi:hypothetical protein|nr:hypothetical protein [Vicinamibacterales bacterium]
MDTLDGGSFDLQLGGESTDVVLLVLNNPGVDALSCVRSCSSIAIRASRIAARAPTSSLRSSEV